MHPGDKDLITVQIAACNEKTILFVKTQRGADRLADNLAKAGVPVDALHGGKSQAVRTRTLKLFREQENAALVATNVAVAVSTLMASHLLCTLMHQQITKIIYTALVAQLALAKLVEL